LTGNSFTRFIYALREKGRKNDECKSKAVQCQMEMNERERQKATCASIQISISTGDNGNECVCLIQSTILTSGFLLLTHVYI
jgi:hypothetical protein